MYSFHYLTLGQHHSSLTLLMSSQHSLCHRSEALSLQCRDDTSYGLLEIMCPEQYSFTDCQYLSKHSGGTYNLKSNHEYYYQIIGQMGPTGMLWCAFFVKCNNDSHLERIYFDAEMWKNMKTRLVLY